MADPISEQIAQLIKTQLETMKVAGAFETTVSDVERPTRIGRVQVPEDLKIIMLQGDAIPAEDHHTVGNPPGFAWRLPFFLDLIVRPSDSGTEPIDQIINKFAADVQKAMMTDSQWNDGTNDLAINTFPGEHLLVDNLEDGYSVLTARYDIVYRAEEDDPYTQV